MIHERQAVIGAVRVNYLEDGTGDPPFLLVHGLGSSSAKYVDTMPSLAQHRRTIAIDLPGFGKSDAPESRYAPGWLAGALRAFMDAAGIERASVVGNSFGGLVSMYVAAAWPERVHALALAAPVLPNDGPQPSGRIVAGFLLAALPGAGPIAQARYWGRNPAVVVAESLARNCVDPSRVPPSTITLLHADAARKGRSPELQRAAWRAQQQAIWAMTGRRETTWSVARSLTVPTLLLWGDKDRVLPPHIGHQAIRQIPGAHLIVMDDCGHNPQLEKPDEFAGALMAFVRAVEATPSR